jgi:hypothetical protein
VSETPQEPVAARELLARQFNPGATATNCVVHASMALTDRPPDCRLCLTDLRNALERAWRVNEWLNVWRDDATSVLVRQEAALTQLQGWEVIHEERVSGYDAERFARRLVERGHAMLTQVGGVPRAGVLAAGLDPDVARQLVDFFERIVQVADGTTAPADVWREQPTSL